MSRRAALRLPVLSGEELLRRMGGGRRPEEGLPVEPTDRELAEHSVVIQAAHRFLRQRGEPDSFIPDLEEEPGEPLPYFLRSQPLVRLAAPEGLTPRWYALKHHKEHWRLWNSHARYCIVTAGRRSGKTEVTKRRLVLNCLVPPHAETHLFAAAPTWQQAKRIWWADLKALSPRSAVADWSDGELWIKYVTGATLHVLGLDEASRIEGTPWDGGALDEYANMLENVWRAHLRPMMAERGGWTWFIGVPEGRNHFYKLWMEARKKKNQPEWETFTWPSSDILPEEEIRKAREEMDEDLFAQEFEGSFRSFRGQVFKAFNETTHTAPLLQRYDPDKPLVLMFDFNVEPGAAVIAQEMLLPSGFVGTGIIGQVHIPYDSNTLAVCRKIVADWSGHRGPILVYGDATGGQRRAEGVLGHNWKLVKQGLNGRFQGQRIIYRVPAANPAQRAGINCLNARLKSQSGAIRMMVDPVEAPDVVLDLEGVRYLEGGSGEIAKTGKINAGRTHWSDGILYYCASRFPIKSQSANQGLGFQPLALGGS